MKQAVQPTLSRIKWLIIFEKKTNVDDHIIE